MDVLHVRTRRWRLGAMVLLALGVASLTTPALSSSPSAPTAAAPTDPILGDWNVTYGAPAVVTMTGASGRYTEIAKTPVRVAGSTCDLPVGTTLATFSGSGNSYSGLHGLWYTANCAFGKWETLSLTLAGSTLTGVLGEGFGTVTFTKAAPISVSGLVINGVANGPLTGLVATMTDTGPSQNLSDYAATVDWGDSSPTSSGVVSLHTADSGGYCISPGITLPPGAQCFDIRATHNVASAGSFRTRVTVSKLPTSVTAWDFGTSIAVVNGQGTNTRAIGLLTFRAGNESDGSPRYRGCAATVVNSPNKDVIVTAGHCVADSALALGGHGPVSELQFAPGHTGECWDDLSATNPKQIQVFQCGGNPDGVWFGRTVNVIADPLYTNNKDILDVAYVVLDPDPIKGEVEAVVGGIPPRFDQELPSERAKWTQNWHTYAYPADDLAFVKSQQWPSSFLKCNGDGFTGTAMWEPLLVVQMNNCNYDSKLWPAPWGASGGPWITNQTNSKIDVGNYDFIGAIIHGGMKCQDTRLCIKGWAYGSLSYSQDCNDPTKCVALGFGAKFDLDAEFVYSLATRGPLV